MTPLLLVMLPKCACGHIGVGGSAHVGATACSFRLDALLPLNRSHFGTQPRHCSSYSATHCAGMLPAAAPPAPRTPRIHCYTLWFTATAATFLCSSCKTDGPSLTRCLLQALLPPFSSSSAALVHPAALADGSCGNHCFVCESSHSPS